MLLERVSCKKIKVHSKNIFLLFLKVVFCCKVCDVGVKVKAKFPSFSGKSKKCDNDPLSSVVNEKFMCLLFFSKRANKLLLLLMTYFSSSENTFLFIYIDLYYQLWVHSSVSHFLDHFIPFQLKPQKIKSSIVVSDKFEFFECV